MPCEAHVSGTQPLLPPHALGTPPPPHVSGATQSPHSRTPPQPSPVGPHVARAEAHVTVAGQLPGLVSRKSDPSRSGPASCAPPPPEDAAGARRPLHEAIATTMIGTDAINATTLRIRDAIASNRWAAT